MAVGASVGGIVGTVSFEGKRWTKQSDGCPLRSKTVSCCFVYSSAVNTSSATVSCFFTACGISFFTSIAGTAPGMASTLMDRSSEMRTTGAGTVAAPCCILAGWLPCGRMQGQRRVLWPDGDICRGFHHFRVSDPRPNGNSHSSQISFVCPFASPQSLPRSRRSKRDTKK